MLDAALDLRARGHAGDDAAVLRRGELERATMRAILPRIEILQTMGERKPMKPKKMTRIERLEARLNKLECGRVPITTGRKTPPALDLDTLTISGTRSEFRVLTAKDASGTEWALMDIFPDGSFFRIAGVSSSSEWRLQSGGRIAERVSRDA